MNLIYLQECEELGCDNEIGVIAGQYYSLGKEHDESSHEWRNICEFCFEKLGYKTRKSLFKCVSCDSIFENITEQDFKMEFLSKAAERSRDQKISNSILKILDKEEWRRSEVDAIQEWQKKYGLRRICVDNPMCPGCACQFEREQIYTEGKPFTYHNEKHSEPILKAFNFTSLSSLKDCQKFIDGGPLLEYYQKWLGDWESVRQEQYLKMHKSIFKKQAEKAHRFAEDNVFRIKDLISDIPRLSKRNLFEIKRLELLEG